MGHRVWLLDGLRAFYRGFLMGLLVVPLCFEIGCIFWECVHNQSDRRASPAPFPAGSSRGSPAAV
jgi:hypothetical protein